MTYKEWMIENSPEDINDSWQGGVFSCPYYHGLESKIESRKNCEYNGGKGCEYCWNREMSDEEKSKMSKEFSLEKFFKKGSKICINCETEEQANEFYIKMDKLGKKWKDGDSYLSKSIWRICGSDFCCTGDGSYWDKDNAIENGYTVYAWEDVKDKFFVPVIEIDENEKTFTKSNLENGMIVEYQNGEKRIVVNDHLLGIDSWSMLESFEDNLTHCCNSEYDIYLVYNAGKFFSLKEILEKGYGLEEIWKRKEPVEFTVKEAEEKLKELLGEEVKIS